MRKFIAFLALLTLFLVTTVQIFAQQATPEATPEATQAAGVPAARPDLVTMLTNDPSGDFTTLVAAIQADEAVSALLSGSGPFTLLAPTNEAFTALETQTGMTQDQLLADQATLTKILLYHILPGQYFLRQLTSGPTLPTELLGQSVSFNLSSGSFTVAGANISDADKLASNGVAQVVDSVLLPPDVAAALATPEATEMATEMATVAAPMATPEMTAMATEMAAPEATEMATPEATQAAGVPAARPDLVTMLTNDPSGDFTTLVAAIQADEAVSALLSGSGPFTLLAPTNEAFTALETQTGMTQDQLLADQTTLTKILLYHILPGQYFLRQLTSGPTLPTELLGQSVSFNLSSGSFTVAGANISDADKLASNGVAQVLDSVLLPPDVAAALATPEATAEATEVATVAAPMATPEMTAMATEMATPEATQAAGVPAARPDLVTMLTNDPSGDFTTLVAAIQADEAVSALLSGSGPFTLLAPTNEAFTALETQTGMTQDQLLADQTTLTKILLYHILPGQYFLRQLTSGPTLPTELLGQSVSFNLSSGSFTVAGANISDADKLASNGVAQVLDSVLLPPDVAAALATPEATMEATEMATVAAPMATPEMTAMATEMATPEATAMATPEATQAAGVPAARPDLVTMLTNDPSGDFTTLVAAIQADEAVSALLSGSGPFTLLAPTNEAFTALETQTGMTQDQLLADQATLTKILLYHILPGQYFLRQLTSGPTLPTELLGQNVSFNLSSGSFTVAGANISDADKLASNGVAQVLDSVLLPPDVAAALATPEVTPEVTEVATVAAPVSTPEATPAPTTEPTPMATPEATATVAAGVPAPLPNLIDTLTNDSSGRFTTFVAVIDAAGLTDTLANGGPYTVLAPTNDAFTALETQTGMTQDQLLANKSLMNEIVSYHVIPGKFFFRQLTSGPTLPTLLQGQSVTFNLSSGTFTVQGANISDADDLASNGVIQVLDSVMLPPDVAAALATPEVTPEATTAVTVVTPEATAPVAVVTPEATPTPEATTAASGAHIRFADFSPDANALDFALNSEARATDVTWAAVGGWIDVNPGSYQISVTQTGASSPIAQASVTLTLGNWVTIAATGLVRNKTVSANVVYEDYSPLAAGNARLSLFDAVQNQTPYDVLLSGHTIVVRLGYPGTFVTNDGFYSANVPAGTYDVRFVVRGQPANVVIDLPNTTLAAGTNTLIVAAGSPGGVGAVTASSDVPTQ